MFKIAAVCVFVTSLLCSFTESIYSPAEASTKPPYTRKEWRSIALNPDDLNNIQMHHNYSRVYIHSSSNHRESKSQPEFTDQTQEGSQIFEQVSDFDQQHLEDLDQVHDKLSLDPGIDDKLDFGQKQDEPNQEIIQTVPGNIQKYEVSRGQANNPPNTGEIQVHKFHYPPRSYEVYPFTEMKPFSNMAFENCPKNVTGQLVYLWSCSQYLNCWKGRKHLQNCPPGTLFNPETLECDYSHKVDCISGPHNQKVKFEKYIAATSPKTGSETRRGQNLCPKGFSGLVPYPSDCKKFINCANGQAFVQDCGPGTAFNSKIQACDWPHKVECEPYTLTEQDLRSQNYRQVSDCPSSNCPTGNPTTCNNCKPDHHQHQRPNNQNCDPGQPGCNINVKLQTGFAVTDHNLYNRDCQGCGLNIGQIFYCPVANPNCQSGIDLNNYRKIFNITTQSWQYIPKGQPEQQQGTYRPINPQTQHHGSIDQHYQGSNQENIGLTPPSTGEQYWTGQNQGFGQTHHVINCPTTNQNCQPGIDLKNYQKIFNITTQTWQYIPNNIGSNSGQPGQQQWTSRPIHHHGTTDQQYAGSNQENIGLSPPNSGPEQQYWTSGSTPQINQNQGTGNTYYIISCPNSNPNCQPGIDLNNYQKTFNITTQTWQYIPKNIGQNGQQFWTSGTTHQTDQNQGFGQTNYVISCPSSNQNCQPGIDLNNYQKIFNITTETWQYFPKNIGSNIGQNGQQYWTSGTTHQTDQNQGFGQTNYVISCPNSNPNCHPGIDLNNYQKTFNITTQTWQYIPKNIGSNVGQNGQQYWTSGSTPQINQNQGTWQTQYVISCPNSNPNCQPGIDLNNYQKTFNITTQTWQYIPKNIGSNVGQNGQQYWSSGISHQTDQNQGFGQTHVVINCPNSNPNCQPGIDLNNYQKIFNITTQTWQYIPKNIGPNVGQNGQQYWSSGSTHQTDQNQGFLQGHYVIVCPSSKPNCQPGIDLNNYQKIFNITTQNWQYIPKNIGQNSGQGGQQQWTSRPIHHGSTDQQYAGSNQQNIGLSPPNSGSIHHGNQPRSYDQISNYQTAGQTKNEAKCPAGHSGLLPHPFICEKFLNCASGRTYVQDCGPGTVFNPKLKVCDWPYNVDCTSSTADSTSGVEFGGTTSTQYHQAGSNTHSHQTVHNFPRPSGTLHPQTGGNSHGNNPLTNTGGVTIQHHQTGSNVYPQQGISNPQGSPGGSSYHQTTSNSQGSQGGSSYQPRGTYNQGTVYHQTGQHQTTSNPQGSPGGSSYQPRGTYNQGTVHHQTGQHQATSNPQGSPGGSSYQPRETYNQGTVYHQIGQNQPISNPQGSPGVSSYQPRETYNQGTVYHQTGQHQPISNPQGSPGVSSYPPRGSGNSDQQFEGSGTQNYYIQPQTTTGRNYIGVIGHRRPNNNDCPESGCPNLNQQSSNCYGSQCVNSKLDFGSSTSHRSSSPSSNLQQNHKNESNIFYITPIPSNPTSYRPSTGTTTPKYPYSKGGPTKKYYPSNVYTGPTPPPESSFGIESKPHPPAPFPSTDINADYDFDTEEVTELPKIGSSHQKPKQVWKNPGKCQDHEFMCKINECIPEAWVCDGNQDCSNSLDEANCGSYINHFTKIPNARLYKHEIEKWLNTDLETCANYCLNSKSFQCRSFNFRKEENTCLMCDTNVGKSGALANSHLYDYYEISKYSLNCTGMYECSNKKCINFSQVCDGNDDCGNRQDEKNCKAASIDYAIRLAGSEAPNEGRVEVKVFGEWGYICDDRFGLRSADVVCKELGFPQGALEVKPGSYFAKTIKDNETYYLMDDVQCFGNESSVRNCGFSGWGVHNCMPQEIIGVVCKTEHEVCPGEHWKCDTTNECLPLQFLCDGVFDCADHSDEGSQHCEAPIELRLAGGAHKLEGRVEIRYRGVWGTICDDDFNDNTAKVVCQSLGYRGSAVAKKDGAFGAGAGPIWLDQVHCFGNESFIDDCSHWNWGEHNCEHSEDAGVVCSNVDTSAYEKRSKTKDLTSSSPITTETKDELFKGKCGHTGEDLFFEENDENSDVQFRVVKGSVAKRGQYPWQATIRVKGKSIKSSHWCGAVVISNKFVLTAAHCLVGFSKGSYVVRAGDYNIDEDEGSEVEAFIEDFFVHERFRQDGHMNNDIALVKLKGPGLRLSKQVQPICLPDENTVYRAGLNCTISGFGSTESGKSTSSQILRAGWVKLQPESVCKMDQVYGESITKGMFCAGSLDEGVDSCDGDSGGPLACLDKGLFTLYGITSWGQRCGHANKPGVYVKIAHYRSWIDKKIEENV